MLGVYVAGGVSGAHLNPAVTLALAVHRGVPVEQGGCRTSLAQIAGAFAGAGAGLRDLSRGVRAPSTAACARSRAPQGTAGIFATYPQPFLSIAGGFVDQVVGTALLMVGVLAVTDPRTTSAPPAG